MSLEADIRQVLYIAAGIIVILILLFVVVPAIQNALLTSPYVS